MSKAKSIKSVVPELGVRWVTRTECTGHPEHGDGDIWCDVHDVFGCAGPCPACDGQGEVNGQTCRICGGEGGPPLIEPLPEVTR
jgi:hypothetical protein